MYGHMNVRSKKCYKHYLNFITDNKQSCHPHTGDRQADSLNKHHITSIPQIDQEVLIQYLKSSWRTSQATPSDRAALPTPAISPIPPSSSSWDSICISTQAAVFGLGSLLPVFTTATTTRSGTQRFCLARRTIAVGTHVTVSTTARLLLSLLLVVRTPCFG